MSKYLCIKPKTNYSACDTEDELILCKALDNYTPTISDLYTSNVGYIDKLRKQDIFKIPLSLYKSYTPPRNNLKSNTIENLNNVRSHFKETKILLNGLDILHPDYKEAKMIINDTRNLLETIDKDLEKILSSINILNPN